MSNRIKSSEEITAAADELQKKLAGLPKGSTQAEEVGGAGRS